MLPHYLSSSVEHIAGSYQHTLYFLLLLQLLIREWPNVLSLLAGLIAIKTLITTALATRVGLTFQESVRIGLLLSQGGEFGFVVFSLANRSVFITSLPLYCSCLLRHLVFSPWYLDWNRLGVLPLELNKLLIIVVVLSMALTPLLNDLGRKAAGIIDERSETKEVVRDCHVLYTHNGHGCCLFSWILKAIFYRNQLRRQIMARLNLLSFLALERWNRYITSYFPLLLKLASWTVISHAS